MASREEVLNWFVEAHYAVLYPIIAGTTHADGMREYCNSKAYMRMVAKTFGETAIRRLMDLSAKQAPAHMQYTITGIVYESSNAAKIRGDFIATITKITSRTGASTNG